MTSLLDPILTPVQRGILRALIASWRLSPRVVLLCARRLGKSHLVCAYLDLIARTLPHSQLVYAAATEAGLRAFSGPIMDQVTAARGGARPTWRASEGIWSYDTGARILLIGADERRKVDRHRGLDAHVVVVDEAAIVPQLEYVVESVLAPMLLRHRGRLLLASSAPESPEHPFARYVHEAAGAGTLVKRTIHDALRPHGLLTAEALAEYARQAGGEQSTTWRREMLCEIVVDATSAVLPEMADAERDIVREVQLMPEHRLRYTSLDVGHVDLTVAALGSVLWREQLIYIEDEVVCSHATSREVAQAVRDQETVRWGPAQYDPSTRRETRPQHWRQADAQPQTLADLADAGLYCEGVAKDDRNASVTRLREMIGFRRLVVHPRCKTIIAHLRGATWAPNGKDFARVHVGGRGHHYDGLDAVRYLVDRADLRTDPKPAVITLGMQAGFVPMPQSTSGGRALAGLVRGRVRS